MPHATPPVAEIKQAKNEEGQSTTPMVSFAFFYLLKYLIGLC
jgi:hypothetical protein